MNSPGRQQNISYTMSTFARLRRYTIFMSTLQPMAHKPASTKAFTYRRKSAPKRQQLPEEVASYVRELIVSGTVGQGEFLRMERIAEAVAWRWDGTGHEGLAGWLGMRARS